MTILQISEPDTLPPQPWQVLDWSIGGDGMKLNSRRFVHNRPDLYAAAPCPVIVNEAGGPTVRLRYCSQDDYDTNFWQDDPLLVARDTDSGTTPLSTPITLSFVIPLHAIGAYVTVAGDALIVGMPFDAVMWVQEPDSDTWTAIHGSGTVGKALPVGTPGTAAFVGALAMDGGHIGKVCFDATLAGSFESLALSRLFWVA